MPFGIQTWYNYPKTSWWDRAYSSVAPAQCQVSCFCCVNEKSFMFFSSLTCAFSQYCQHDYTQGLDRTVCVNILSSIHPVVFFIEWPWASMPISMACIWRWHSSDTKGHMPVHCGNISISLICGWFVMVYETRDIHTILNWVTSLIELIRLKRRCWANWAVTHMLILRLSKAS